MNVNSKYPLLVLSFIFIILLSLQIFLKNPLSNSINFRQVDKTNVNLKYSRAKAEQVELVEEGLYSEHFLPPQSLESKLQVSLPEAPEIEDKVNQLLTKKTTIIPKTNKKFGQNNQKYNIIFLKTHKTGSSTIQNILFNYVFNRQNLQVLFPLPGSSSISTLRQLIKNNKQRLDFSTNLVYPKRSNDHQWKDDLFYDFPESFTKEKVATYMLPPGNIIAHHAKYSTEMQDFFENQNHHGIKNGETFRFTILRNPRTLLKSAYSYYSNKGLPARSNFNFTNFINSPEKFWKNDAVHADFFRNSQKRDLGVKDLYGNNIEGAIDFLEKSFDLIMILEKFDESIILMKDHLTDWQLTDFLYMVKNQRSGSGSKSTDNLSENRKIDKWAKDDTIIYHYFSKILDQKIENYGRTKMAEEVKKLREISKKVVDQCFTTPRTDEATRLKTLYWFPPFAKISIPWVKEDQLKNTTCRNLGRSERKYHNMMRKIAENYQK